MEKYTGCRVPILKGYVYPLGNVVREMTNTIDVGGPGFI